MALAHSTVILLVDDDPTLRTLLMRVLVRAGYVVVPCSNALDAMDHLKHGTVSVVVSDIAMPKMSGLELLSKVREQEPDVPVVLMTGQDEPSRRQCAEEQGAFAFLSKPFDPDCFERTVAGAAEHYYATRGKGSVRNVV